MNFIKFAKNPLTPEQLINAVANSVVNKEKEITQVQEGQWEEGKDSQGKYIGFYKKSTELFAKEPPRPKTPKIAGQPYNLNWSGDLRKRLFARANKKSNDVTITIDSKGKAKEELFDTIKMFGNISNPRTVFGVQKNKNADRITKIINRETLVKLKRKFNV